MNLDHVIILQSLLNDVINKYDELFHIKPFNKKAYVLNIKLREAEQPLAKDFAKDVIKAVFTPEEKVKLFRIDKIKLEA
jgi:hypothetical protein